MNVRYSPLVAALVAVLLGAYAGVPAFSATEQTGPAPNAPTTKMQAPDSGSADKIMPAGKAAVCARLDANHDGHISKSEFRASGKSAKDFQLADVSHRGWLTLDQ